MGEDRPTINCGARLRTDSHQLQDDVVVAAVILSHAMLHKVLQILAVLWVCGRICVEQQNV